MSPTVVAFLHFLYWASHYVWLCFAPDSTGTGNHIQYGGNIIDCWRMVQHVPLINGVGGQVANHCIAAGG